MKDWIAYRIWAVYRHKTSRRYGEHTTWIPRLFVLLFMLLNLPNTGVASNMQSIPLVDVCALSRQLQSNPIQAHLVYATPANFTGSVVVGYEQNAHVALLTPKAAHALIAVENDLTAQGFTLFIYDAYRPQRAVQFFKHWSNAPVASAYELERKKIHYPHLDKNKLFDAGYISETSQHLYGHTVDVVLADLETLDPVDLGCVFDYLDPLAHHRVTPPQITNTAYENRQILRRTMERHGFIAYEKEFWHYSFSEREQNTPLDIPITHDLAGIGSETQHA